uniref:Galacturonosyltransferase 7 n=2 Tax=Aegilops tauschii subsp. strangulata TaxID=200361 RepID=A0A453ANK0_AEGTS
MKATPPQRRRGPRLVLLALVLCSLLVPLAFIFDRAPTGYVTTDERRRQEVVFHSFDPVEPIGGGGGGGAVDPVPVKVPVQDAPKKISNGSSGVPPPQHKQIDRPPLAVSVKPKVLPVQRTEPPKAVKGSTQRTIEVSKDIKKQKKDLKPDEVENLKACQLEFGSYCLWSTEHKVIMKDSVVKRLKDQLFVARSYYPSIAKLQGQEALTQEMKQNIQDHERVLSASSVDADLPSFINKKIEQMEHTIAKAKSCTVECHNVVRKLRQILDMTDDEAHFHMKQSAFPSTILVLRHCQKLTTVSL